METQFTDRVLTCSDCRSDFIFTAGEQTFFHEKQFKNDPKRCKTCKQRRAVPPGAFSDGKPVIPSLARTETRTECSQCGIETTVPFKPTQGRPVLCRACFQQKNRIAAQGAGLVHQAPVLMQGGGMAVLEPVATYTVVPAMGIPVRESALPEQRSMSAEQAAGVLSEVSMNALGESISADAALLAAVCMNAAEAGSSTATLADLESISALDCLETESTLIPYGLLKEAEEAPGELVGAMAELAN